MDLMDIIPVNAIEGERAIEWLQMAEIRDVGF